MKTNILSLGLSILFLCSCSASRQAAQKSDSKFPKVNQNGKTAIVAHRGSWNCEAAGYSENSIASLSLSQEQTLWGSECDIHLTADGKVIVNHDPVINNLRINDTDFATLSECLLKNGEKRPSFEAYVARAAKSARKTVLVVELKKQKNQEVENELLQKTVSILKSGKMFNPDKVVFITFSKFISTEIASKYPEFTNQYLNGELSPSEVAALGINGIDYHYKVLLAHPEWIAQAHELGMSVNVWTINKEEQMRKFIELGVDQITTNEPLLLREILGNKEYKK